jgi:hypothetical protein
MWSSRIHAIACASLLQVTCVTGVLGCDLCAISGSVEADKSRQLLFATPVPTAPDPLRCDTTVGMLASVEVANIARHGSERVDADGQRIATATAQLTAAAKCGDFGLRGYLPWMRRVFDRQTPIGLEFGRRQGLGDATIEGTWIAAKEADARSLRLATVIVGVKAPTGRSDELDQEAAAQASATHPLVMPHDLALGSGSWDGIAGLTFFARGGEWFGTARALGELRTTGRAGYRYGSGVSWGGGPGRYLAREEHASLGLLLNCTGEVRARDHLHGSEIADSGLAQVALGPDLSLTWRGLSAECGVDIPVIQHLGGTQLVDRWRFHAGAAWSF